jgi:hypothetical protein
MISMSRHFTARRANGRLATNEDDPIETVSVDSEIPIQEVAFLADANDNRYSASDWFQILRNIRQSTILRAIRGPVITVTMWSLCLSVIHKTLVARGLCTAASRMCISSQLHSFLVSALGLLLVFRTNSAYQRFAEGRQILETVLSTTRNTSRMVMLYDADVSFARRKRIFRLLAAFPYLLHYHIQPRGDASIEPGNPNGLAIIRNTQLQASRRKAPSRPVTTVLPEYRPSDYYDDNGSDLWVDRRSVPWNLFSDPVVQQLALSSNRPLWVCDRLSQECNDVPYSPNFTSTYLRLHVIRQLFYNVARA